MTDDSSAQTPELGLLARAVGMVTAPTATFKAVVAHPRVAGMLFLSSLVVALAAGLPQFTERGRQATLDAQVKQSEQWTNQKVSDEQYAQMQKMAPIGAYGALIGAFVSLPIVSLIFAGIYFVVFNAIMGGTATFKQVLTVVAHSQVIGALGAALAAPIQYMQGTVTMFGPFNLGVLVPMLDENSFLVRLLGSTSVFTIWGLLVTGIGFGVLYKRSGLSIGVWLNVIYLGIAAGAIALFSSLMGR